MMHATLLTPTTPTTREGPLQGHVDDVLVHVRQTGPEACTLLLLGLVDSGRNPVGGGVLALRDGRWTGRCDDLRSLYDVTGDLERLEFVRVGRAPR